MIQIEGFVAEAVLTFSPAGGEFTVVTQGQNDSISDIKFYPDTPIGPGDDSTSGTQGGGILRLSRRTTAPVTAFACHNVLCLWLTRVTENITPVWGLLVSPSAAGSALFTRLGFLQLWLRYAEKEYPNKALGRHTTIKLF